MGSKNIIWMMFYVSLTPFLMIKETLAEKNSDHDPRSLDEFLHDYAQKVVDRPRTGTFYNISLRSNYSGMEISYVKIKTASLWTSGINTSFIHVPPKTRTRPFVKRLDLVFHDLGNLSSYYCSLPNHRFVTPVIGFTAYNGDRNVTPANRSSIHKLKLQGNDTILVQFPDISLEKGTKRCVRFHPNGHVVFSNVSSSNICHVHGQGHFSIVVRRSKKAFWKRKGKTTKWWAIGLGVGIGVLFVGILVWILVYNYGRKKKVKSMQRETENSEALDTVWVGRSKMPSAGGIRTQPVLEHDFLP